MLNGRRVEIAKPMRRGLRFWYLVVPLALGLMLLVALAPREHAPTPAPVVAEDSRSTAPATRATEPALMEPADLATSALGRDIDRDREPAPVASDALAGNALARMQRSIEAREYQASRNDRGLQTPNRKQNLRTYFEPTGIRVHDRTAQGGGELLGLRWTGIGRGASLASVPEGEVGHEGARVEIRRAGLLEWYLNSPAGLEQGFTLAERPTDEGPLVLELALSRSRATLAGDRVILATLAGRKLAYGELVATDARGDVVLARSSAARDR